MIHFVMDVLCIEYVKVFKVEGMYIKCEVTIFSQAEKVTRLIGAPGNTICYFCSRCYNSPLAVTYEEAERYINSRNVKDKCKYSL